ncbi:ATP-binding protein [Isosphaeraceae bacterium EP7]
MTNTTTEKTTAEFEFVERARREATPLLIGLVGPSGAGKTKSALRLATGIQKVRGGKLVGIDTEARRMLHYADEFDLTYLEFKPPFSSLRYLAALKAAAEKAEGGVVIVDSMSHEHEGEGGYLEYHETELDRLAGTDWKKRERMTFTAWIKPAQDRRRLINSILQMNCAFVFDFRAKEKLKIVRGQEPIQLGWQAIAGEEFAFEMTVRCLLQPGANGVPDWSEEGFRNGVPKRSEIHRPLIPDGAQLSEQIGERLAQWAKGTLLGAALVAQARAVAEQGTAAYSAYWQTLSKPQKTELAGQHEANKELARQAKSRQEEPEEAEETFELADAPL